MKTPYLDELINELHDYIEHVECVSHVGIPKTRAKLAEFEAIKEALNT